MILNKKTKSRLISIEVKKSVSLRGVLENMEKMENRENIKKMENINQITLYLSLKTLYLSARWLKTLIFTAFVTAVEKIVTYALGEHDPGSP